MSITKFKAALETLTALEIEALKSAINSSYGNGHDFGFTDDIKIPGQSKQVAGALVASLIKKGIIERDCEFGQFAFGEFGDAYEYAEAAEEFIARLA